MMEGKLREQLNIWLKQEVVQPSSSPWSFPLIVVPKKNGKTRWVIDYRQLNEITIKDSFPLPNIEDDLAHLADSQIFSRIDGAGTFHVIPIWKEDQPSSTLMNRSSSTLIDQRTTLSVLSYPRFKTG